MLKGAFVHPSCAKRNSPIKALSDSNSEFFKDSWESFLNCKGEAEDMQSQMPQYLLPNYK